MPQCDCPECGELLNFSEHEVGMETTCPECGTDFDLPDISEPPEPPPTILSKLIPEERTPVESPPVIPPTVQVVTQVINPAPIPAPPMREGMCPYCRVMCRKKREASDSGGGCLIILIGIALIPFIVGFFIILYGAHVGSKCNHFWECTNCKHRFPRKRGFFELG